MDVNRPYYYIDRLKNAWKLHYNLLLESLKAYKQWIIITRNIKLNINETGKKKKIYVILYTIILPFPYYYESHNVLV